MLARGGVVGLLLADGQAPVRLRAHEIGDAELADLAARATALRARTPTVSLAVGPTVPLPRRTGPAAAPAVEQPVAVALAGGDDAAPADVDEAYLSEEELSAEWAAYARSYQDRHQPGEGDGGPPG